MAKALLETKSYLEFLKSPEIAICTCLASLFFIFCIFVYRHVTRLIPAGNRGGGKFYCRPCFCVQDIFCWFQFLFYPCLDNRVCLRSRRRRIIPEQYNSLIECLNNLSYEHPAAFVTGNNLNNHESAAKYALLYQRRFKHCWSVQSFLMGSAAAMLILGFINSSGFSLGYNPQLSRAIEASTEFFTHSQYTTPQSFLIEPREVNKVFENILNLIQKIRSTHTPLPDLFDDFKDKFGGKNSFQTMIGFANGDIVRHHLKALKETDPRDILKQSDAFLVTEKIRSLLDSIDIDGIDEAKIDVALKEKLREIDEGSESKVMWKDDQDSKLALESFTNELISLQQRVMKKCENLMLNQPIVRNTESDTKERLTNFGNQLNTFEAELDWINIKICSLIFTLLLIPAVQFLPMYCFTSKDLGPQKSDYCINFSRLILTLIIFIYVFILSSTDFKFLYHIRNKEMLIKEQLTKLNHMLLPSSPLKVWFNEMKQFGNDLHALSFKASILTEADYTRVINTDMTQLMKYIKLLQGTIHNLTELLGWSNSLTEKTMLHQVVECTKVLNRKLSVFKLVQNLMIAEDLITCAAKDGSCSNGNLKKVFKEAFNVDVHYMAQNVKISKESAQRNVLTVLKQQSLNVFTKFVNIRESMLMIFLSTITLLIGALCECCFN